MPSKCSACGKTSRGDMPVAKINGEERIYCADCFWKLEKEYKSKKNCEECSHFSKDACKKKDVPLEAVTIGYSTYFVQAENCGWFNTDKQVAIDEIRKLELAGRYEDAAAEYERLGMPDESVQARKKIVPIDVNAQVKALVKQGKTVTFYCPHCGEQLKIGFKVAQIQKVCPKCSGDLEVVNLGKLINQHLA